MQTKLKAPFPAIGGKAKVTRLVWQRLGNVANYIEPFCNSAAVLLQRPHAGQIETVNDWDCHVSNFWRAVKYAPALVAEYADNPVNEADLHARHRWLVLSEDVAEQRRRVRAEADYFDPKAAGWWVWGACCWIGGAWCVPPKEGRNMAQSMPFLNNEWNSGLLLPECTKTPHRGLTQGRPQLADAFSRGRGVNGHDEAGTCAERRAWLLNWFKRLQDRLRTVRVCCGDWLRVCDSPSTTTRLGLTGIFLDPPYRTKLADGKSNRSDGLYASDRDNDVNELVDRVIAYCIERGNMDQMRLAVCCYEGEGYEVLADHGWTVEAWKASGGYSNQTGKSNDNANRERIWFSPNCQPPEQPLLFQELESHEPAAQLALAA
jgi:DNA adenine methylase